MVEVFPWRWPNTARMTPFDNMAGPYTLHSRPATLWNPPMSEHFKANQPLDLAPAWRSKVRVREARCVLAAESICILTALFCCRCVIWRSLLLLKFPDLWWNKCKWYHLFHVQTCGRVWKNLLSSLKRHIFHSWVVCQILSNYICLA